MQLIKIIQASQKDEAEVLENNWEIEIFIVPLEESIWVLEASQRKNPHADQCQDELVCQNQKCKAVPFPSPENDVEVGKHWKNFNKWAQNR